MKELLPSFIAWFPVILRGFLWIVTSMIPVALANLKALTPDKVAHMTYVDWTIITLEIFGAGFIAWRLYLDQSLSVHKSDMGIPLPGTSGTGDGSTPIFIEPTKPNP